MNNYPALFPPLRFDRLVGSFFQQLPSLTTINFIQLRRRTAADPQPLRPRESTGESPNTSSTSPNRHPTLSNAATSSNQRSKQQLRISPITSENWCNLHLWRVVAAELRPRDASKSVGRCSYMSSTSPTRHQPSDSLASSNLQQPHPSDAVSWRTIE